MLTKFSLTMLLTQHALWTDKAVRQPSEVGSYSGSPVIPLSTFLVASAITVILS